MPDGKIFVSYARKDSVFALKLVKDLREKGAEIWVDQHDIKFGNHWDSTVEKAIDFSACVIVILSPTSILSKNVMDEVSYALDQDKTVIPILINDCKIPIRLSRLQRVDFKADYQLALDELLNGLGLIAESKIISVDKKKSSSESKSLTEFKKMAEDFLAKHGDQLNPKK